MAWGLLSIRLRDIKGASLSWLLEVYFLWLLVIIFVTNLGLYTLPYGNIYYLSLTTSIVYILIQPMGVACLPLTVKLSYPIPETVSNGLMIMVANTWATLIVIFEV